MEVDLYRHVQVTMEPLVGDCIVPILAVVPEQPRVPKQLATGTLFSIGTHRLLVTASHGIRQYREHGKMLLYTATKLGSLIKLDGCDAYYTTGTKGYERDIVDVGVWKLSDEVQGKLSHKRFLNQSDVFVDADFSSGWYYLVGFTFSSQKLICDATLFSSRSWFQERTD